MAQGSSNMTTHQAKHLIGDSTNVTWGGALLHSGTDGKTSSMDTWIYADDDGTTAAPWGIKHNQNDNNIEYIGAGTTNVKIHLGESKITASHLVGGADTWYTARTFTIKDADNTNAGAGTSVQGNEDEILHLPSTIKASLTGNASTATALTSNAGGTEQPIYFTGGKPAATSYALKATVNNGTAGRLSYYSGDRAISATTNVHVLNNYLISNSRNGVSVDIRANGLIIWGQTYGNTANQMVSNTAGVFRFGDGGPQIVFNTSNSWNAQAGALVFTDHDTAGTGTSFHFVSTESNDNNGGNCTVTAPRFRARRGITIGQNSDNTSYNLYVNGSSYFNGNTTHNGIDYFANGTTYYINNSAVAYFNDLRTDQVRLVDNWIGFYQNANAGGNRYGYIQADANRMYFRKENGTSTYAYDFAGTLYNSERIFINYKSGTWVNSLTNSAITLTDVSGSYGGWICGPTKDGRIAISTYQSSDNYLYVGYGERGRTTNSFAQQIRWDGPNNILYTNRVDMAWLRIVNDSSNTSDDATVYIQCQTANDWALKIVKGGKNYGIRVDSLDQGDAIWTNGYVRARCVWANQGSNGERQVGTDSTTSGTIYLWSNTSEKGLYSGSGYQTGYIIRITSNRVYFADAYNRTNTALAYSQSALGYDSYTYLAGWNGYELRAIAKTQFARASHSHSVSDLTWANGANLSCTGGGEWSVDMNGDGYWHVWSGAQSRSTLICYNSNSYVAVPIHLYVGGYNNTSYGLSASSIACNGNLWVSASNATGGGIILADDGDIVDLNDGYCAMRFSSGVRIFSANRGGSAVITLYSSGHLYASGELMAPKHLRIGSTILRDDGADVYFLIGTRNSAGDNWNGLRPFMFNLSNGVLRFGHGAYGAVWNDFAEFRKSSYKQAGHTVVEDGYGCLKLCQERLAAGARIISDTFGMAVGQSLEQDTPIGIGGRVLAYTFQNRNNFKVGDAVCAAPNGTIDLMTREEIKEYPDRIIGIVSEIPQYEIWTQQGAEDMEPVKVKVNNRIWVYVR